jgi:hypothetical protein
MLYKIQYYIEIYDNRMNEEIEDMNVLYRENAVKMQENKISKDE